jgi:hypothetical protein
MVLEQGLGSGARALPAMADDQEPRVIRATPEVPHGAPELVAPAAHEHLAVHAAA